MIVECFLFLFVEFDVIGWHLFRLIINNKLKLYVKCDFCSSIFTMSVMKKIKTNFTRKYYGI